MQSTRRKSKMNRRTMIAPSSFSNRATLASHHQQRQLALLMLLWLNISITSVTAFSFMSSSIGRKRDVLLDKTASRRHPKRRVLPLLYLAESSSKNTAVMDDDDGSDDSKDEQQNQSDQTAASGCFKST